MNQVKEQVNKVQKVLNNFWQLALYTSMIGLAVYVLYEVKTKLAGIGLAVVLAAAATVVVVEGTIRFIKYLSK